MRAFYLVVILLLSKSNPSWSQFVVVEALENMPKVVDVGVSECVLLSEWERDNGVNRSYTIFYEVKIQYGFKGVLPQRARIQGYTFSEVGYLATRNAHHDLQHHEPFSPEDYFRLHTYIISYDFKRGDYDYRDRVFPTAFAITSMEKRNYADSVFRSYFDWNRWGISHGDEALLVVPWDEIASSCEFN